MENKTKMTPRTDAEAVFPSCNDSSDTSHPQGTYVATDFARTLERELTIELGRATHYRDQWQRVTAELAAERARLEAVVNNNWSIHKGNENEFAVYCRTGGGYITPWAATDRAAIDAAIKEETK